jgi:thioredoxin 1
VKDVTDADFQKEVLESKGVVLVDLWAPWCGPCKAMMPTLAAVSDDHPDVQVMKVNVDDNQATAETYDVRSIPTLLVFKDGQLVDKQVGGKSKAALEALLKKHK